jgi:hypothetical protein
MSNKNRERPRPPNLLDRAPQPVAATASITASAPVPTQTGCFVRHRYDANGELMNPDAG